MKKDIFFSWTAQIQGNSCINFKIQINLSINSLNWLLTSESSN